MRRNVIDPDRQMKARTIVVVTSDHTKNKEHSHGHMDNNHQRDILGISNSKSLPLSSLDLFIESAYHPRDRRSCC
jgi:hypothetical protein